MQTSTSQPLAQELERIRAKLLSLATGQASEASETSTNDQDLDTTLTTENLDILCQTFSLSASERQVLLGSSGFSMLVSLCSTSFQGFQPCYTAPKCLS